MSAPIASAFSGAICSNQLQLGNLAFSQELVKQLPQKEYIALDDLISYKIHNNQFREESKLARRDIPPNRETEKNSIIVSHMVSLSGNRRPGGRVLHFNSATQRNG